MLAAVPVLDLPVDAGDRRPALVRDLLAAARGPLAAALVAFLVRLQLSAALLLGGRGAGGDAGAKDDEDHGELAHAIEPSLSTTPRAVVPDEWTGPAAGARGTADNGRSAPWEPRRTPSRLPPPGSTR